MQVLFILDYIAELIQFVFELGVYTRKYVLPVLVFLYVVIEQVVVTVQQVRIPVLVDLGHMGYYNMVRKRNRPNIGGTVTRTC